MPSFDALKEKLSYLEEEQIAKIERAFLLASEAHSGQTRESGEPYLTHPIEVAMILAGMRLDYQSIITALLHDVVEDTSVGMETIAEKFGSVVADLVDGLTKLSQIEILSHAEIQAESFRKMVLAMSRDIRVILIKLADRLHNMKTLHALSPAKRHRIAKETLDIYAPIANRLGLHVFCIDLEDLSFYSYYPRRYRILLKAVEKTRTAYKATVNIIEEDFRRELSKKSFLNLTVFAREKHLYSIYKRMQSNHISFADATSMYAFRIIVDSIDDCYRALGIVHSLYKPVPGKFVDYIAMPKLNGYQSLHTYLFGPQGVQIEIQIRTQAMDKIANYGILLPVIYHDGKNSEEDSSIRTQRWINNLLTMQSNTGSSLEFIDDVKNDLFPDEIYVFTPKGNIIELPKGATVVDFAYMVHTDIGNTCVAAKIDHKFIPLSNILSSGQTVSIVTNPEAKPNPSWLNFVVTGRARNGIRNFLKNQQRSEAISFGKELLTKAFLDLESSLGKISSETLQNFLKANQFKNMDSLYEEIGLGNQIAVFVAHQILNSVTPTSALNGKSQQVITPIQIEGAFDMVINFATCCYPVPDEPIVGYLQSGKGLIVHRENCTNLSKLKKKTELFIPVSWSGNIKGDFRVGITVEIVNQPGALATLAQAIASAESNIEDIRIKDRSSTYSLLALEIMVKNRQHLDRVLRIIENLSVVHGITRNSVN